MPFIDCKVTVKLTEDEKKAINDGLCSAVSLMHKSSSYLMVGVNDGYDLYFSGKKLEAGAFVDVRAFGGVNGGDCRKMTAAVCKLLKEVAGIPSDGVYITYEGYENWGWNGDNF